MQEFIRNNYSKIIEFNNLINPITMEGKGIINGLKSKYIISHINNFIKDKYFTLKLFSHSKKCQNKFEINYSLCIQIKYNFI